MLIPVGVGHQAIQLPHWRDEPCVDEREDILISFDSPEVTRDHFLSEMLAAAAWKHRRSIEKRAADYAVAATPLKRANEEQSTSEPPTSDDVSAQPGVAKLLSASIADAITGGIPPNVVLKASMSTPPASPTNKPLSPFLDSQEHASKSLPRLNCARDGVKPLVAGISAYGANAWVV